MPCVCTSSRNRLLCMFFERKYFHIEMYKETNEPYGPKLFELYVIFILLWLLNFIVQYFR